MITSLIVFVSAFVGGVVGWHAHKKVSVKRDESGGGGGPKEPA